MTKPAIKSIHFIKAFCALGILAYHFSAQLADRSFFHFFDYATGSWEGIFISVFFMVSGALMYYHYEEELSLPRYCVKRWKAIFPMFYLAYGFFWIRKVLHHGTIFYKGAPFSYLLTLLGLDGYLAGSLPTYYILGEWFLGAIIVLYVLFPLLRLAFRKSQWITFAAVLGLYALFLDKPITNAVGFWTISSCLASFVCGMMLTVYRKHLLTPVSAGISLVAAAILLFVKIPISTNLSKHLMAIPIYILLSVLGEWLMNRRILNAVFTKLSALSYPIFLLHHQVIRDIVGRWKPAGPLQTAGALLVSLAVTLIGAELLSRVTEFLTGKLTAWLKAKTTKIGI